jgi:hypothetical protein
MNERWEHCMIEWLWGPPNEAARPSFRPSFTVYFGDGRTETHEGGSPEIAAFFGKMGQKGWAMSSAINAANWVAWTMQRREPAS